MTEAERELERFVGEHFDSEEAVTIVLALRNQRRPLDAATILEALEAHFGLEVAVDRLIAVKRVELRVRDLIASGLVENLPGALYRYREKAGFEPMIASVAHEHSTRRTWLNRVIYSAAARAHRHTETFRR